MADNYRSKYALMLANFVGCGGGAECKRRRRPVCVVALFCALRSVHPSVSCNQKKSSSTLEQLRSHGTPCRGFPLHREVEHSLLPEGERSHRAVRFFLHLPLQ